MNRRDLQAGQIIDGFRLVEPLESGGMASFWRVTRDGIDTPMVMKIPLLRPGEDPLTIIGYEVEQMNLPRLTGPHIPRVIATGDFERPYIVIEFSRSHCDRSARKLDGAPLSRQRVRPRCGGGALHGECR
ncbi:MAG TPA: hypothetical protein VIY07_15175 [Pseudolabrys sp.]